MQVTAKYLDAKQSNNLLGAIQGLKQAKRKDLGEMQERVINHFDRLLDDLNSLPLHGQETKKLIEMIEYCKANIDFVVPLKIKDKPQNVEKIRKYLVDMGMIEKSKNNFIKHFQKNHDEIMSELFEQENY